MSYKDTKNSEAAQNGFLNSTAATDFGLYLTQVACFGFLAVTTSVMAYNSFAGFLQQHIPPTLYYWGMALVVAVIYLVIDHRLDGAIFDYWKTRDKIRKDRTQVADYRAARRFFNFTVILLVARFGLTITASWWSAGEVADMGTEAPDNKFFVQSLTKHDSLQAMALTAAKTDCESMRASEPDRVARAKAEGARAVRRAIASGNPSQQAMWKRNPGYFSPPPRNQWYPQNKSFADRVHAAQAKADALEQSELDKTAQACGALVVATNSLAHDTVRAGITGLATGENLRYEARLERRTKFVLRMDLICALLGFIVLRVRYLRKCAGGFEEDFNRRNLPAILGKFFDRLRERALVGLEELLGIDIDGDGHIGSASTSGASRHYHSTTPPPTTSGSSPAMRGDSSAFSNPYTEQNGKVPDTQPAGRAVVRGFQRRTETPSCPIAMT